MGPGIRIFKGTGKHESIRLLPDIKDCLAARKLNESDIGTGFSYYDGYFCHYDYYYDHQLHLPQQQLFLLLLLLRRRRRRGHEPKQSRAEPSRAMYEVDMYTIYRLYFQSTYMHGVICMRYIYIYIYTCTYTHTHI